MSHDSSNTEALPTATRPPRWHGGDVVWLAVWLAVAFGVRGLVLDQYREHFLFDTLLLDAESYDQWGQQIADGQWLHRAPGTDETMPFYQDSLYAYVLGLFYGVFGRDLLALRFCQIMLGSLAVVLGFAVARRLWGGSASWTAAVLLALCQPLVFYEVQVLKSFLSPLLVLAGLWSFLLARDRSQRWWLWIVSGLFCGASALVRGNFLLLAPALALGRFVSLARTNWRPAVGQPCLLLLGMSVAVVPSLCHNLLAGGEWILTTAQAGESFYAGNGPQAQSGIYSSPAFASANPARERFGYRDEALRRTGRKTMTWREVSRFWFAETVRGIRQDPSRWLGLLGKKAMLFWSYYDAPGNYDLPAMTDDVIPRLKLLPVRYGWLAGLALAAMLIGLRDWRRTWPLYVVFGVVFSTTVAFYVFGRFRLSVTPLFCLWVAGLVHCLLASARPIRSHWVSRLCISLLAVLCLWFCHIPVRHYSKAEEGRYRFHENLAELHRRQGQDEAAKAAYQSAIDLIRDYPVHTDKEMFRRHYRLGHLYFLMGDQKQATAEFRRAFTIGDSFPDAALGHFLVGNSIAQQEQFKEALQHFDQAVRLDPRQATYHRARGNIHQVLHRTKEALRDYQAALKLNPNLANAHWDLGLLYFEMEMYSLAAKHWRRVKKLKPQHPGIDKNLAVAERLAGYR